MAQMTAMDKKTKPKSVTSNKVKKDIAKCEEKIKTQRLEPKAVKAKSKSSSTKKPSKAVNKKVTPQPVKKQVKLEKVESTGTTFVVEPVTVVKEESIVTEPSTALTQLDKSDNVNPVPDVPEPGKSGVKLMSISELFNTMRDSQPQPQVPHFLRNK